MRMAREGEIGSVPIHIVLNGTKSCGIRATQRKGRCQLLALGIDSDCSNLILAHSGNEQNAAWIVAFWRTDTELFSVINCNTEH